MFRRQPVTRPKQVHRFLDIEDTQRKVVEDAQVALRHAGGNPFALRSTYHHVFDPIGAVWNLLRDPLVRVIGHAAMPIGPEPQHRTEEWVLGLRAMHDIPDMNDVHTERIDWN